MTAAIDWSDLSDADAARVPLAEWNLSIGKDLPPCGAIDTSQCLAVLDRWVRWIEIGTANALSRPEMYPELATLSEAEFRVLTMVTLLQRSLEVRYSPALVDSPYDARDSGRLFLTGLLSGEGGTCATMPVLYAAVGRRLGYPLKLVRAKAHLFCRWDPGAGERFNIEATSYGYNPRPDEHYVTWPHPLAAEEIARGWYLQNLTPREELAVFFEQRGACLLDHLRFAEAAEALSIAEQLAPEYPFYRQQRLALEILRPLGGAIIGWSSSLDEKLVNGVRLPSIFGMQSDPHSVKLAEYDLNRIVANRRRERGLPALWLP